MRWAWGVLGATAGLVLSTTLIADRLTPSAADSASQQAEAGAGGDTAVVNPPCPQSPVPVALADHVLAGLRAGRPQVVAVSLNLDDLGELAHAEGSVAGAKLTVDPALQRAFQAEMDLRVEAVLLVAELPADRVVQEPVLSATASVMPAAAGAATAGATVQLYGSVNLRIDRLDEVCRAARSADVAAIAATTPDSFGR
ncbi:MAG: hypothetical protein IT196_10970 [Acidimicrobiales bacterium]|nr:hypothetical protein [Acidimicrobiales bacterium]